MGVGVMSVAGRRVVVWRDIVVRVVVIMIMAMFVVSHVPTMGRASLSNVADSRRRSEGCVEQNQDNEQEGQEETHGPDYIRGISRLSNGVANERLNPESRHRLEQRLPQGADFLR